MGLFCSEGWLLVWHWEKDDVSRTLSSGIKTPVCAFPLLSATWRKRSLKEKLGRWSLLMTFPRKGSRVLCTSEGSPRRDDRQLGSKGKTGQQDAELCADSSFLRKKSKQKKTLRWIVSNHCLLSSTYRGPSWASHPLGMVVHTYDGSTHGGRDRRITQNVSIIQRQPRPQKTMLKNNSTPYNPTYQKKGQKGRMGASLKFWGKHL